jgi:orotidine-5'-phosphate decarboxylase
MNFKERLITRINCLQSKLCVGLDPEWEKLPSFLKESSSEPLFDFCKEIVNTTFPYTVAYKPNIAFFERFGSKGLAQFEKLIFHIKEVCPQVLVVSDSKRGDLANTSKEYARYYFDELKIDSLTVSPYMGRDSLEPYLKKGGHIFSLCLTSNPGSYDLQYLRLNSGKELYIKVAEYLSSLEREFEGQIGIVVGATHISELSALRTLAPSLSFLIPGFGAQGAQISDILPVCGHLSLINSSRAILFASSKEDFAMTAGEMAKSISREMSNYHKEIK